MRPPLPRWPLPRAAAVLAAVLAVVRPAAAQEAGGATPGGGAGGVAAGSPRRTASRPWVGYALPASSVTRVTERITQDGVLDEPVWFSADSITEFRTREPREGGTPSQRTVVRVLATPDGLAIGWWNYDTQPHLIRRTQMRRDAMLMTDDYVGVAIDGLYDQRSGFYFRANANGAMWDGEHVSAQQGNDEWDGVWDVRTRIGDDGWYAEMLIPWATLRYRRDGGAWGMNFRRFIRRTNEEILWSSWKRTEGFRFLEAEGEVDGFGELPPRARVELRPYALGEARLAERTFDRAGADRVVAPGTRVGQVGLDLKLPLTNTLTLDLTANPDFAQAEVDRQIVNLTRFPLFFPEQRPFFTEGASIFEFGVRQQTQLFYSRRIGLAAGGIPTDIAGGARVQGRAGRQQVGFLLTRAGDPDWGTAAVARVKRDVLGRGFVGAMATHLDRVGRPGSTAGGLDFALPYRVFGDQNFVVSGNAAWNADSAGAPLGGHYRLLVDYPNDLLDLDFRYDRVEQAYAPQLGFVQQRGIHRIGGGNQARFRPRAGRVRRWEFNLLGYNVVWNDEGRLDNANFSVKPLGLNFHSGDRFEITLNRRVDNPSRGFGIFPGITLPAGDYTWDRVEARWNSSGARWWGVDAEAGHGGFYRGTSTTGSLGLRLRLEPHVLLNVDGEVRQVNLPAGSFTARAVRLRTDYAATPRLNTTLFAQYDNQSNRASVNARLRWTTQPGSDLYVVWTSGWRTEFADGIRWDRPERGGLVVKYVQFLRY